MESLNSHPARVAVCAILLILAAGLLPHTGAQAPPAYANFEGAQTNPVRLSADRTRLYAVNTPNATLSVFDLTNPASPALIAQIPVGLEPVSVNPRTDDEVWVVNQISNSISVVSVSKGIVTDTIPAVAEPMDVVFAGAGVCLGVEEQLDRGIRRQHACSGSFYSAGWRQSESAGGQP